MNGDMSVKERTNCTLNHAFSVGLGKRSSRSANHSAICKTMERSANNVVKISGTSKLRGTRIEVSNPQM